MTTASENKALVREFFDRLNAQDLDVVDELCADGFSVTINRKGTDESAIGTDGLKTIYEEYYAAFPHFRHTIDEMVAEGEFRGVQPTDNEIAIEDNGLLRISG